MRTAFSVVPQSDQATIRKQIRSARRSLNAQQQRIAALNLRRNLARHPLFNRSRRISFYWPNDGEIDLTECLKHALAANKICFLPVLYRGGGRRLLFGQIDRHTQFKLNRYGIPEPDILTGNWVYPQQLDLLLAPLVAFDHTGNRIGMGGGYYDNSLHHLRIDRQWQRPYILGIAHELQHVPSISRNAWDIPLKGAVTDKQIYSFEKR